MSIIRIIFVAIIIYNLYGVVSSMENTLNTNTNTIDTTINTINTTVQNCYQQMELKNKINTCSINTICCRNTIYETQIQTELNKCAGFSAAPPANITDTRNRFKTCQTTCKNKLPTRYICRDGNNVGRNSIDLYDCYTNCFNKLYNCPSNQILTTSTGQYLVSTVEVVIVCVIVVLVIICLFRVTVCSEDNLPIIRGRGRSRSKVHNATTTSYEGSQV